FLRRGHLHIAAERQPGDGVLSLSNPSGEPFDRRAQAEREAVDIDPGPLRGDEMSRLVHEDQHTEGDDQWPQVIEDDHFNTSLAQTRDHWSAARTVSRSPAGAGSCSSSTRSIVSEMRPNGTRPSRNAATAVSLAALNTAGAVPPARPAERPAE